MEVVKVDRGLEQGGGGCPNFGPDIIGSGSVGYFVRARDVGDDAAHQEVFAQIPPQVGLQFDREATL